MDQVYLSDNVGQNLQNLKVDSIWNRYVIINNFRQLNKFFNANTSSLSNQGELIYLNFSDDNKCNFNDVYSGGVDLGQQGNSDYKLQFLSKSSSNNNSVLLNVLCFIPALLEIDGSGDVSELLS